jgi:tRNA A-37 threonylcarbamoyl transferase component Bud32
MRADESIADAATLLPGAAPDRAGDYVIERALGAGAMGDVFAGRHPLIGKRVAIKIIKRHLAASPEASERFVREARAVNQVDHPNVVDIFAVGRLDDGRLYLVMDLLDGEALSARLVRGRPPADETLTILAGIAAALDAAHARGVVHRDLKPDNVFLAEGRVLVLDFGIAKLLAPDGAIKPGTLTEQGAWLGTPAYMAPEQWGAEGAGPASDRYALGAIAYEMLAGKPPFAATSLPAMMEMHFRAPVPSISAAVDQVLTRALAKDPAQRYPTATAMVDELRVAMARGRARRPVLVPVLGVATALAAIATAAFVLKGGAAPSRPRTPPAAAPLDTVELISIPPGATVRVDDVVRGVTPLQIPRDALSRRVTVEKPGFAPAIFTATATTVTLQPIRGFEGVWALPDGELRAFERRGDQVAMFTLTSANGERIFKSFFEFTEGGFSAAEPYVDARGPDEPSCHVTLAAEYLYDPATDALSRRQERAHIDFANGRCALRTKEWGGTVSLRRLDGDAEWAESTAGAGKAEKPSKMKKQPSQKK